jgi:hypothetical protein
MPPDHLKGINALPSMNDYNTARASAIASGKGVVRTADERRALSAQLEALREKAMTDKNGGPVKLLSRDLSKESQNEILRHKAMAAGKGAKITANEDSDCLESLTWKDGVATATFYRGGAIVYDYEMSKEEFLDWAFSGSLGKYGNENVF